MRLSSFASLQLLTFLSLISATSATAKPRQYVPIASPPCLPAFSLHNPQPQQPTTTTLLLKLRGGNADAGALAEKAYDWATNMGAPAALVAGAVIATLYESMSSGSLDIDERIDGKWVKVAKRTTRLFLVSAFILQIVCIYCTTVLGTHLLFVTPIASTKATTALSYLREHYEFEYLTSRIAFLQGLVTWLAAIAVEHAMPQGDETPERRNMDILIASSLTTLIIAMISFYNGHMNFYANYADMLKHYGQLIFKRYFAQWPPKVLTVVALPSLLTSVIFFVKVFLDLDGKSSKRAKTKLSIVVAGRPS